MKSINKRSLKIASLFILLNICVSYAQPKGDIAIVSGKWERGVKVAQLTLFKVNNGTLETVATSVVNPDNTFYFACKPASEGFYFIGYNPQPTNRFTIYLKGGDRVDMTITEDSWRLNGTNNSPENTEMEKWYKFIQPVERKAIYFQKENSTFHDFFPLLTEKATALASYPPSRTGNKTFDRTFDAYKNVDFTFLALAYMYAPRGAGMHPSAADFPDYYRNLDAADYTKTTALLNYPSGLNLIDRLIYVKAMSTGTPASDPAKIILENIGTIALNDTIKGELTLKFASLWRTYFGLIDYQNTYGKYLITEKQKEQFNAMLNALNDLKEGAPAIDFKFADMSGKQVALSDFKGKVVYIDIWATWCGPCKQELPHLKKLEEEYSSNPNIVFLSVSVDAQKDMEKWKKFVTDEKLKGVQIFAGDKAPNELMKPYNISGIPRFMLIGKNGNLVSVDAPRPSSSEIRATLKALLP